VTRLPTARRPRSRLARCHAHVGLLRSRVCVCMCVREYLLGRLHDDGMCPAMQAADAAVFVLLSSMRRTVRNRLWSQHTHTHQATHSHRTGGHARVCATDVCPCRWWCGLALLCSAPIGFASVYSDNNVANCKTTCGSDASCLQTCENQCYSTLASCDAACGDSTAKIMKQ
jgi:hypothetical protein